MLKINRTTPLERRSKQRYPISLNVRYRTVGRANHMNGFGRTVNISSDGMLIGAVQPPMVGTRLEVNLEWPTLLDGAIPLQMVALARVVRTQPGSFALSFGEYQFRTLARRQRPIDSNEDLESVDGIRRVVSA